MQPLSQVRGSVTSFSAAMRNVILLMLCSHYLYSQSNTSPILGWGQEERGSYQRLLVSITVNHLTIRHPQTSDAGPKTTQPYSDN